MAFSKDAQLPELPAWTDPTATEDRVSADTTPVQVTGLNRFVQNG